MADREGLLASTSTSYTIDLPHSPGSGDSSPTQRLGKEDLLDYANPEDQTKASILEWLRMEMRKEFKGLLQEHKFSLGSQHPKPTQPKRPWKESPSPLDQRKIHSK